MKRAVGWHWCVAACVAAAPWVSEPALAQTVYRCGTGSEASSYSHQPCAVGGRMLRTDDARTDGERQVAQDLVERDRRLADALERDRRAEARRPAPRAVALNAPRPVAVASTTQSAKRSKASSRSVSRQRPKPSARVETPQRTGAGGFKAVVPGSARKSQTQGG